MKITGSKQNGGRMLEVNGKRFFLDEKSYDAGYEAAMSGKDAQGVLEEKPRAWACRSSWAAGYTDAISYIGETMEMVKAIRKSF